MCIDEVVSTFMTWLSTTFAAEATTLAALEGAGMAFGELSFATSATLAAETAVSSSIFAGIGLAEVGAVAGIAGAAGAIGGALRGGRQAEEDAEEYARRLEVQGDRILERERQLIDLQIGEGETAKKRTRLAIASGNLNPRTGTALLIARDIENRVQENIDEITKGTRFQVEDLQFAMGDARRRGTSARTASRFRAGALLLGGAEKAFDHFAPE